MLPEVVILRNVREDLLEAHDWYERQRVGLGTQFLNEVTAAIERIRTNPTGYEEVHHGVRRAASRRFPYGVLYRHEPGRVTVIAVLHFSRDPQVWRDRV